MQGRSRGASGVGGFVRARRVLGRRRASAFAAVFSAVLLVSSGGALGVPQRTLAAQPDKVFTVNSLKDAADPNATGLAGDDGICSTGAVTPAGDPECTLRAAIENQNANRNVAHNLIRFAVDLQQLGVTKPTIKVGATGLGALPPVLGGVTIDGTTQKDAAGTTVKVELDGSMAGAAIGLRVLGGGSTVQGLTVMNFASDGILVGGTPPPGDGGHFIVGNLVTANGGDGVHLLSHDTAVEDNLITGNGAAGVHVDGGGATRNSIAGNDLTNSGDGVLVDGAPNNSVRNNVSSGNGGSGIHIVGANASGNLLQGNRVGTNAGGTAARANGADGVRIEAPSNQVGVGTANVISGNAGSGVHILGASAAGNLVQDNRIGTNADGTAAVANGGDGVFVEGAPGNTIGGIGAGRNLISGNGGYGVRVDGLAAAGDLIEGNSIGLDAAGAALPNTAGGVLVKDAPNTAVGGPAPGAGNSIVGKGTGVDVDASLVGGITVKGNFIGKDGTSAKFTVGVLHRGKPVDIEGNVITNFLGVGIDATLNANAVYNIKKNELGGFGGMVGVGTKLSFGEGVNATINYQGNVQKRNEVGLQAEESLRGTINWNVSGNHAEFGGTGAEITFRAAGEKKFNNDHWSFNAAAGFQYKADLTQDVRGLVKIEAGGETYKGNGSTRAQAGDGMQGTITTLFEVSVTLLDITASGNGKRGISLEAFGGGGGKVTFNGTRLDASLNGELGFRLENGTNATPFLSAHVERGIFSHNTKGGMAIFGVEIKFSIVGNEITDNGDFGIDLGDTSDARVAGNTISGNGTGILVEDTAKAAISGNTVSGNGVGIAVTGSADAALAANAIFGNTGLGIDLGNDGVTPNDPGEADGLQNFPLLTSVVSAGGATTIGGTLDSVPSTTFAVELFANGACNASGFGEGEHPLGSAQVATDGGGHASFAAVLPTAVPAGQAVTAIATRLADLDGDPATPATPFQTSEFSRCLVAGGGAAPGSISGQKFLDANGDGAKGSGESGLQGWTIFLDSNGNGQPDAGEPQQTTDASGTYSFGGLAAGSYVVREVLQAGFVRTAPVASFYSVALAAGQSVTGRDFGNRPAPPPPANLAPDPDFEGPPDLFYFTNGPGVFSWASDMPRSGAHALKIVSSGPSDAFNRWLSLIPQLAVTPGRDYQLCAFFKTQNVQGTVRPALTFWTATQTYIAGSAAESAAQLAGTQPFTELCLVARAPAGAAFARIEFRLSGSGTVWIDDALLAESAADTTPPETTITDGPSSMVLPRTATFAFVSSEPDPSFACSLDGAPFTACTSPKQYDGLALGPHTFAVRATDRVGNTDPTPATRSWTIAADSNLAPDPDFEGPPDLFYFTNGPGVFSWASDMPRSGAHALKIVSSGPSDAFNRWLSLIPQLAVTPGRDYQLCAFFKTQNVQGTVRPALTFWTATQTYIAGSAAESAAQLAGTQPFTELCLVARAPAGAAFARIEFRLSGSGTVWIDDVVVTPR